MNIKTRLTILFFGYLILLLQGCVSSSERDLGNTNSTLVPTPPNISINGGGNNNSGSGPVIQNISGVLPQNSSLYQTTLSYDINAKSIEFSWTANESAHFDLYGKTNTESNYTKIATITNNNTINYHYAINLATDLIYDSFILGSCDSNSQCLDSNIVQLTEEDILNLSIFIKEEISVDHNFFGTATKISANGKVLVSSSIGSSPKVSIYHLIDHDNNNTTPHTWQAFQTINTEYKVSSISISETGSTIALGMPNHGLFHTGTVRIYTLGNHDNLSNTPHQWSLTQSILPSNTDLFSFQDKFGFDISLNSSGNKLAVSVPYEDSKPDTSKNNNSSTHTDSGAVYIFSLTDHDSNSNTPNQWQETAFLKAPLTGVGLSSKEDLFGYAIDFDNAGNTLVITSPFEDSNLTGINPSGNENNLASNAGATYVYRYADHDNDVSTDNTWALDAYFKSEHIDEDDLYGYSTQISPDGNTMFVGSFCESSNWVGVSKSIASNNAALNSGAIYMYTYQSNAWSLSHYIKAPTIIAGQHFSKHFTSDANHLYIGAPNENGLSTGVIEGYWRTSGNGVSR